MEKYISMIKELTTNFSFQDFISLINSLDKEIINGNIKELNSEFIYYYYQIISMVNDNYKIDDDKLGTLGHMLVENALLEKKKITPTLAVCFFLEKKHDLEFDQIFNKISFYEQEGCSAFINDENDNFNINWQVQDRFGEDVDRYNYEMMKVILHELTHIYQATRTEETTNIFDKLVFYDYQQLKNLQNVMNYSLDRLIHDSFISEFMAEENALVYMLNLAQQHPEFFNNELIQTKISEYQARKKGNFGEVGNNPRKAEEKIIQLCKDNLEYTRNNYEKQVRFNGIEHTTWIINTNEKMLANYEEIDKKRNPLIAQLQAQGISEKENDSYYNIYLKTLYQFDGQSIILNSNVQEKGFSH